EGGVEAGEHDGVEGGVGVEVVLEREVLVVHVRELVALERLDEGAGVVVDELEVDVGAAAGDVVVPAAAVGRGERGVVDGDLGDEDAADGAVVIAVAPGVAGGEEEEGREGEGGVWES